ncbi:MAG: alpha-N-arabinofuranosidase, partial [Prevotella sp.]|nr:alpha-N-arabinofuranosidase [Prevotella sp.]
MKGKFSLVLSVFVSLCSVNTFAKGNLQKGNRYLYCHMNDAGPAWTAYALSRDGLHWHDLLNGDSIFSDAEMAP